MSKRLTDEELTNAERLVECTRPALPGDRPNMTMQFIERMGAEIRARRSADLSKEEALALDRLCRELRLAVIRNKQDEVDDYPHYEVCLALLDRLLAAAEGEV